MTKLAFGTVLLLAIGGAACGPATPAQPPPAAPTSRVRQRPRRNAVTEALRAAALRAQGCLPAGVERVRVAGSFRGATGAYVVDRVEPSAPISNETRECVRTQFETATVPAFQQDRFDAEQLLPPPAEAPNAAAAASSGGEAPAAGAQPAGPVAGTQEPAAPAPPTPVPGPAVTEGGSTGGSLSGSQGGSVAVVTNAPPPTPPPPSRDTLGTDVTSYGLGPLTGAALRGCYTPLHTQERTLAGYFRLQFNLTREGELRAVAVSELHRDGNEGRFRTVMRCVQQRVTAMQLGARNAGAYDLRVYLNPADASVMLTQNNQGALAQSGLALAGAAPRAPSAAAPGETDERAIFNVVAARRAEVAQCYQGQLARDPSLRLRARVRFTLQPAGTVSDANALVVVTGGDPDRASDVGRCLEGVVRATTFAAREGGAPRPVEMPFDFGGPGTAGAGGEASSAGAGAGPDPQASAVAAVTTAATGHVSAQAVSSTLGTHAAELTQCYTQSRASDPALAGRLELHLVIDGAGALAALRIQPVVHGGQPASMVNVARCVHGVLQRVRFPAPVGGNAAVLVPLEFAP